MQDVRELLQLNIDELDGLNTEEAVAALRESAAQHKHAAKEMRKVFLLTGVVVLSLAVVFFGILAWFANNKQVTGQGITTNVQDTTAHMLDYSVYYCTKNADDTVTYNAKIADASTSSIVMPDYDAALDTTERNKYTSVIVRIPITRSESFDGTSYKVNVVFSRDPNATWDPVYDDDPDASPKTKHYMSNIIQVKCAEVPDLWDSEAEKTGGTTYAKTIYDEATEEFSKVDTSGNLIHPAQTFVNTTTPTGTYLTSLSFDITGNSNIKVYNDAVGEYKTYIYLQIDYCRELVELSYGIKTTGSSSISAGTIGSINYQATFDYDENANIACSIIKIS